jgi:hypothetical protein
MMCKLILASVAYGVLVGNALVMASDRPGDWLYDLTNDGSSGGGGGGDSPVYLGGHGFMYAEPNSGAAAAASGPLTATPATDLTAAVRALTPTAGQASEADLNTARQTLQNIYNAWMTMPSGTATLTYIYMKKNFKRQEERRKSQEQWLQAAQTQFDAIEARYCENQGHQAARLKLKQEVDTLRDSLYRLLKILESQEKTDSSDLALKQIYRIQFLSELNAHNMAIEKQKKLEDRRFKSLRATLNSCDLISQEERDFIQQYKTTLTCYHKNFNTYFDLRFKIHFLHPIVSSPDTQYQHGGGGKGAAGVTSSKRKTSMNLGGAQKSLRQQTENTAAATPAAAAAGHATQLQLLQLQRQHLQLQLQVQQLHVQQLQVQQLQVQQLQVQQLQNVLQQPPTMAQSPQIYADNRYVPTAGYGSETPVTPTQTMEGSGGGGGGGGGGSSIYWGAYGPIRLDENTAAAASTEPPAPVVTQTRAHTALLLAVATKLMRTFGNNDGSK